MEISIKNIFSIRSFINSLCDSIATQLQRTWHMACFPDVSEVVVMMEYGMLVHYIAKWWLTGIFTFGEFELKKKGIPVIQFLSCAS